MKTQFNIMKQALVAAVIMTAAAVSFADDLNPPDYRGAPLSVHAHWAGNPLSPTADWYWVDDDNNPDTTIYPTFVPSFEVSPGTSPTGAAILNYDFRIPNIIDKLPIKYLRIQLTWIGTTQPPIGIHATGYDDSNASSGNITHASNPLVFTQPDGGYQYFDMEFRPNPDFETISVAMAPDAELVQVVVDSVSTIPEPATLLLLMFGSVIGLVRR